MHALTSAFGLHPRQFGKRRPQLAEPAEFAATPLPVRAGSIPSDVRLFAITFASGFLFVSIFIA